MFAKRDDESPWFIHSGASSHMSCNREWYDEFHEKFYGTRIYLGDNRSREVQGYGVISVNILDGQFKQIHNVMYVPGITNILIYVSVITNNDMKVEFGKYKCHVKDVQDHYKVIATRAKIGGLYKLDAIKGSHHTLASSTISNGELWHQRYEHLNYNDLMLL